VHDSKLDKDTKRDSRTDSDKKKESTSIRLTKEVYETNRTEKTKKNRRASSKEKSLPTVDATPEKARNGGLRNKPKPTNRFRPDDIEQTKQSKADVSKETANVTTMSQEMSGEVEWKFNVALKPSESNSTTKSSTKKKKEINSIKTDVQVSGNNNMTIDEPNVTTVMEDRDVVIEKTSNTTENSVNTKSIISHESLKKTNTDSGLFDEPDVAVDSNSFQSSAGLDRNSANASGGDVPNIPTKASNNAFDSTIQKESITLRKKRPLKSTEEKCDEPKSKMSKIDKDTRDESRKALFDDSRLSSSLSEERSRYGYITIRKSHQPVATS
jgi:hypothetical protein